MISILGDLATEWSPLDAVIRGVGTFEPKDGTYPFYARIEPESMAAFREELVTRMKAEGIELASTYAFNPHITIAYIPKGDPVPEVNFPDILVKFDQLALSWGEILSTFNLNGTRRPVMGEAKAELRRWREKVIRGVKRGKTPGDIEFTLESLPVPLYEAVRAGLAQAEDTEAAKAVFDDVRDSFTMSLGKQVHRKGLTDLLIPVGAGETLSKVEITFGEIDGDTSFWDANTPDYAGLLTADVVNRKSNEVQLIALLDRSDWAWDDSTKTYYGKVGTLHEGITIDLDGMLALRDSFVESQKSVVTHYTIRLADGDISVQDWYRSMVGVIKQAYMAEFALSKGGLRNMTAKNWEILTNTVVGQIDVFTRCAQNVSMGKLTLEDIMDKGNVYLSGSVTVF
jgi:2'-5' RNA ligase